MSYLIRKIARAKWPDFIDKVENIASDAISDIRTQKNTLSTWKVDSLDDIDSAALALAASSKTERIENMCIVWIPEEEILNKAIAIDDQVAGDTIVPDLMKMHRDLYGLTYGSLGTIADIIIQQLSKNYCKRYTKKQVERLLIDAFNSNRIHQSRCTPNLLEEIKECCFR